jgi:glycosyltransferase involved in cell wall biosynthesis
MVRCIRYLHGSGTNFQKLNPKPRSTGVYMRVAIDSTPLLNQRTGVGQYTYHLIRNLLDLDSELDLILFCVSLRKPVPLQQVIPKHANLSYADYRLPARLMQKAWNSFGFPHAELFTGQFDIFHATNFTAPPQKSGKLILTIHDVGFARMPENHPQSSRILNQILPHQLERADKIIVVSGFTRDEVVEVFAVPERKIRVIHNGVSPDFHPVADKEAAAMIARKYRIDQEYILFVGKLEARKNINGVVEAYGIFKKQSKMQHKLVLAGSLGWKGEEALQKAVESGLEKDVIHLGYVPDEDLPWLMSGATVFLYPSLYEGFGIPTIEAMACGIPVIASNSTSLPEVVGDAGLLVDPDNTEEIATALSRILDDASLRDELVRKGLERCKDFTWRKAAEQTFELYRELGT